MRIAMIGHKQIPGRSGGVETVVEELSTRIAALGIDTIVYNRGIGQHRSSTEYKGVHLVDVPTPNGKNLNALVYSYSATFRAILEGVDVIHYHALGPAAAIWLAKVFRKRTVVTVHGLNYKTPKWRGLGARYIKLGEKLTARFADEIIVLSESVKDYFESEYGRATRFVPNGVTMPDAPTDVSVLDEFRLSPGSYVLCVSRLVPGKGLETLVRAFEGLDGEQKLVIAGDSKHSDGFKQALLESAKVDSRITFTGFLNRRDLAGLYANARLFVLPSEAEGMPMSLLEAMWFDCPCLVSNIEENLEVLSGHGESFRAGEIDDLATKLMLALCAPPRRTDTRSIVSSRYDWDRVALETTSIYGSAIHYSEGGLLHHV